MINNILCLFSYFPLPLPGFSLFLAFMYVFSHVSFLPPKKGQRAWKIIKTALITPEYVIIVFITQTPHMLIYGYVLICSIAHATFVSGSF